MNKLEIMNQYESFLSANKHIKREDFVISAGGACVVLGIRDNTEDMDMGIPVKDYNKFLHDSKYHKHDFMGTTVVEYNEFIDLHPAEDGETVSVNGVTCFSPKRLLEQKMRLNRPKDQNDIVALKKLIKEKPKYINWN